ncbi:hypothetical protein DN752_18610 [Echinicola strongylocentroti]|uniref:Uncharacterized protein n=1 Tax=Echinicola strongylocentroti TaxID=1795355 RepID=A0A2Z4IM09_9BACT|nr:hypothetical protein DN752_18610 [Echinicola strongylocentroti]
MSIFSCESELILPKYEPLEGGFIPRSLPLTYVNADTSDIMVPRMAHYDIHTDNEFEFIENAITIDKEWPYYHINDNRFSANYQGILIYNATLNGKNMSVFRKEKMNYNNYVNGNMWQLENSLDESSQLQWSFIPRDKSQRYIVQMNDLPQQVTIHKYPDTLSRSENTTISFSKANPSDSIYFALKILPKENFEVYGSTPTLYSESTYPTLAKNNQFTFSPADLYSDHSQLDKGDSVFISIVTVKRVVKIIEGQKTAITYKNKNTKPVNIIY